MSTTHAVAFASPFLVRPTEPPGTRRRAPRTPRARASAADPARRALVPHAARSRVHRRVAPGRDLPRDPTQDDGNQNPRARPRLLPNCENDGSQQASRRRPSRTCPCLSYARAAPIAGAKSRDDAEVSARSMAAGLSGATKSMGFGQSQSAVRGRSWSARLPVHDAVRVAWGALVVICLANPPLPRVRRP
jgi:hypothetical protein